MEGDGVQLCASFGAAKGLAKAKSADGAGSIRRRAETAIS
jgi:hypothetical protein